MRWLTPAIGFVGVAIPGQLPASVVAVSLKKKRAVVALVAGHHARAVPEDPAASQAGEQRLGVVEGDERRYLRTKPDAQRLGLGARRVAVDLEARAAVPEVDR